MESHTGAFYRELPILDAARRCGLVLNNRTLEWEEVEASCPFCGDNGPGKYHLSLNTRKNVYRCNLCNASGNSVSLYARMEGVSNRQAFQVLSEEAGKPIDPMELVYPNELPLFDKYDEYLPQELVQKGFALGVLDLDGLRETVRGWSAGRTEQQF